MFRKLDDLLGFDPSSVYKLETFHVNNLKQTDRRKKLQVVKASYDTIAILQNLTL